jgi:hypothetical protein
MASDALALQIKEEFIHRNAKSSVNGMVAGP